CANELAGCGSSRKAQPPRIPLSSSKWLVRWKSLPTSWTRANKIPVNFQTDDISRRAVGCYGPGSLLRMLLRGGRRVDVYDHMAPPEKRVQPRAMRDQGS